LCEKVGIKQPQYFGFKRLRNLRSSFDEESNRFFFPPLFIYFDLFICDLISILILIIII